MAAVIQSTKGKINPLKAWLLIISSVLSLFLLDAVLRWLYDHGRVSALFVNIAIGVYTLSLFALLLFRFSISCTYFLDGVKICFGRVYIKNARYSEQIMLREIVFFGRPDDAKSKYAVDSSKNFTARRGEIETMAIVYRREKKTMRILFSPNEEMRQKLEEALKQKK